MRTAWEFIKVCGQLAWAFISLGWVLFRLNRLLGPIPKEDEKEEAPYSGAPD
jgi:hypothetical protein